MHTEALLVTLALAGVTLPLALAAWRGRSRPMALSAAGVWLAACAVMAWTSARYGPAIEHLRPVTNRPIEVSADGYVSSRACRSCHPREYETWDRSYHSRMTTVATPANMIALWPQEPRRMRFNERDYRIQARGDEFWVELDDPEWEGEYGRPPRVWRQVVQITGSHHWQFFWFATGHTRKLQLFPFAYRVADEPRWMPLDGCCVSPPDHRQASGIGRWSRSCNKCHATHGRPRVEHWEDMQSDSMDTHVVELGIACEACHGPGGEHVALNRDPQRRYALHLSGDPDPSIVNPELLDHERSSMVCGSCHAVTRFRTREERQAWNQGGMRFRPGEDLDDFRLVETQGDDRFWPDGMIRVGGREYNGLLRSPCYERGEMSCFSCHQLHPLPDDPRPIEEWADDQLKPGMRGNLACTQCHEEYTEEAALVEHTHHPADSSGSNCYDCHMPYTSYGLLKGIRTHEVHEPSVAATLATGRPNGCNQCHLDRTLEWAADHLHEWYGVPVPELSQKERTIAASVLWATKGDAGLRALAAWSMGWEAAREVSGTDWMTPYLTILLIDEYRAVRYIAHRTLGMQEGYEHLVSQYDFADSFSRRNDVSQRVYAAWENGAASSHRTKGAHLLVDEQGHLLIDEFTRLLELKDKRDMLLNE